MHDQIKPLINLLFVCSNVYVCTSMYVATNNAIYLHSFKSYTSTNNIQRQKFKQNENTLDCVFFKFSDAIHTACSIAIIVFVLLL